MALSRHLPLANIKVIATDIDKQVIDTARMGLYNEKSIASVPDDLKKKYFTKVGNSYQISDEIKKRVEFKEHDLLKDPYPGGCNLIVCRNVVIYFTEEAKDEIYAKFYKALATGGRKEAVQYMPDSFLPFLVVIISGLSAMCLFAVGTHGF